jgi:hypothetical protein
MLGYLIARLYAADILFALAASTKIMSWEETARRLELVSFGSPEDWHRLQELILPLSVDK